MKLNGNLDLLKVGQLVNALLEKNGTLTALAQIGYDTTALRAYINDGISAKKVLQENDISTAVDLGGVASSDLLVPSQLAVKTYVDGIVSSAFRIKGDIDCSTNPNYPAAIAGDAYVVTVAGKIGGASGVNVNIGDLIVAKADNAGGTQAAVGSSWFILESNRDQATETVLGVIKLATQALTNAGTDDLTAVTPLKLTTFLGLTTAAGLIGYDNTTSLLTATTVQGAIDEIVANQKASGFVLSAQALVPGDNTIAHAHTLTQATAVVRDATTKNEFIPNEIKVDGTNVVVNVLVAQTVDILVTIID